MCDTAYDFRAATLDYGLSSTCWADDPRLVLAHQPHGLPEHSDAPAAQRTTRNLKVEADNAQVTLRWAAPTTSGAVGTAITGYRYRFAAAATVPESAGWIDLPDGSDAGDSAADETSLTITGLTNDTVHAFELRAVNVRGAGTKTSITATPTKPSTLELESVTGSFSTVTLAYNQLLNSSSVPDKSHFTTSVGTVPQPFTCGTGDTAGTDCFSQPPNPTVTNVAVIGRNVVLTLDAPYPQRYSPSVGEWHVGMYVKYNRRTTTIQAQGGTPRVDNSCGQAHIGIPRVSHWRLLGCFWTNGYRPSYTGPGMPVTRTSPTLSQLSGRRITDIQISGPGDDNQWTNGETVDITVTIRRDGQVCQSQQSSNPQCGHRAGAKTQEAADRTVLTPSTRAEPIRLHCSSSAPSSTGRTRACASRPIQSTTRGINLRISGTVTRVLMEL